MKCKKCGAEVKAGDVFCAKCGAAIQIVPDYYDMEDYSEVRNTKKPKQNVKPADKKKGVNGKIIALGVGALVVAVALVLGISLFITNSKNSKSYTYQAEAAKTYLENGLTDKALECAKKALALDSDNEDCLFLLYDIYSEMGDHDNSISTLHQIIDLNPNSYEAYSALITLYVADSNYEAIIDLSKKNTNEDFNHLFKSYVPVNPTISVVGGHYEEEQVIEITANENSIIYYTLDGSDPKVDGIAYTEEIILDDGAFVLRAIATNEYGIFSEEVSEKYEIVCPIPPKPVVSVASGMIEEASMVEINVPEGCTCYYTWDGSNPNASSIKYTEPFDIPAGNNVLSVVFMNAKQQCGDVARFNYIYYPEEDVDEDDIEDSEAEE